MAHILDTMADPLSCAVFDSFYDIDTEIKREEEDSAIFENLFNSVEQDPAFAPTPKLERKRKSLNWDDKPLEKRGNFGKSSFEKSQPLMFQFRNDANAPVIKRKRGRPRKSESQRVSFGSLRLLSDSELLTQIDPELEPMPYKPNFGHVELYDMFKPNDLSTLSDLFLGDEIKPTSKQLMKARKSEDWDAKPEDKKRQKWDKAELKRLWEGIAKHGNNWTDIRSMFTTRSYCQIKDKGRRCLFLLGWETGRSKVETDSSSLEAKRLAKEVLARMR